MLYNGNDEFPDQKTLKLSDMYLEAGMEGPVELELTVKVFNINNGRNEEIMRRSETLNGYKIFIHLVKTYMKSMSRDSAILKAIDDCIRQNVLKKFLEEHASEVKNMLLTEWDNDKALAVAKKEAREDGRAEGIAEGIEKLAALLEKGVPLAEAKRQLSEQ